MTQVNRSQNVTQNTGVAFQERGFTIIELLVVISILLILASFLLPVFGQAKGEARRTVCMSNIKQIGVAFSLYQTKNDGFIIPSYNMTGYVGGAGVPLDGWAAILDRDGYVTTEATEKDASRNVFYCPETVDVYGMAGGQTGTDPSKPKGYQTWPCLRLGSAVQASTTIPSQGFNKIVLCSYWINAYNPIGSAVSPVVNNLHYTGSVGYSTGTGTVYNTRASVFKKPSSLIALADGVYAGKQASVRLGITDLRIGYRHNGAANVLFADGHVETIRSENFPRGSGGGPYGEVQSENINGAYTLYADPETALP